MAAVGLTRDFYVRSAVIRGDIQTYASQLQILIDGCEILVATSGHLLDFAERCSRAALFRGKNSIIWALMKRILS